LPTRQASLLFSLGVNEVTQTLDGREIHFAREERQLRELACRLDESIIVAMRQSAGLTGFSDSNIFGHRRQQLYHQVHERW
jgi:hypothetical protein